MSRLRTPVGQVLLLGVIMLCVPGIFNALTSMAGGIDDPAVASQATAVLYVMFAVVSLLAPVPTNIIGPRATCCTGTLGYIVCTPTADRTRDLHSLAHALHF